MTEHPNTPQESSLMPYEPTHARIPPVYSAESLNRQSAPNSLADRVASIATAKPAACLISALTTGVIIGWLVKRR